METWIGSIVHSGLPGAFGVLGALIAYAVASHLGLHNGFRLVLAVAGFAGLFVVSGGFVPRPQGESQLGDSAAEESTAPPLWKYAGAATDATGTALAGFFEDALVELRSDPVVRVNFLYGVLHSRVPPQLSWRLERRFRKLTARVAEEGQRPAEVRVDSVSAVALGRVMVTRLRLSHGEGRAREILRVMSDPANGLSRPREVCEAATAVYSTIASMPLSEGGPLMLSMLARQSVAPG